MVHVTPLKLCWCVTFPLLMPEKKNITYWLVLNHPHQPLQPLAIRHCSDRETCEKSVATLTAHQRKYSTSPAGHLWGMFFPPCIQVIYLVIQSDLFGMVKWPFQGVKWPPTRGWKGHFESPGMQLLILVFLVFLFSSKLFGPDRFK